MRELIKELLKFPNFVRRKFMQLMNRNYVKNKLEKRKGECKKCSECCKGCRYLDKQTRLCRIYNNRPWLCYKDFPLDKSDKKIWKVKDCGYCFDD